MTNDREAENTRTTLNTVPDEAPHDVAETPGTDNSTKEHDDALVDEWEEESFPASDPPAHY
ncbi:MULTISPECIES: hypothetical protein [Brevibacterium]|uniref:Uncharacterized protein n=1 Tax=Brevibacterium picturae TaxID=260553 RepID=A0ABN2CKC6_9MICO|nr:hypothetical protein [Brevibacterium sandarakinum]MDN5585823.1 hypothetical protein [Brevibacterium sp.]MDN5657360.1 hypothetical protein [Brevibacterium sandarakinum]